MCENMKPKVFLSADLVTPSYGQGHRKWYKMLEVNGAFNKSLKPFNYKSNQLKPNGTHEPVVAEKFSHSQMWSNTEFEQQ